MSRWLSEGHKTSVFSVDEAQQATWIIRVEAGEGAARYIVGGEKHNHLYMDNNMGTLLRRIK